MDTPATVLVTGAGGFVGRHVMATLRTAWPDARLVDDAIDIRDHAAVDALVAAARPDRCIHLAGVAAVGAAASDPDEAWAVNLGGTLTLARALRRWAPSCRLVFAGSAESYGASFRGGELVDEDRPLAPLTVYAATKAAADLALGAMAASEGLDVVRLRPTNHTGPGQRPDFVVASFARQVALIERGWQRPEIRTGALAPERDFLDVRDVARAYMLAGSAALAPGTVLNIGAGAPRAVGSILAALLTAAGLEATVEQDAARIRSIDLPRAGCDAARAEAALGWRPSIPWSRTLVDVLDDWRVRIRAEPGAFDRSDGEGRW